jgi:hypothetical protein
MKFFAALIPVCFLIILAIPSYYIGQEFGAAIGWAVFLALGILYSIHAELVKLNEKNK